MADVSVFVAGASEDQVRAAVEAWADQVGFKHFDVEEATAYPGFTVAVDLYLLDEDALEGFADQLVEALPFPAASETEIDRSSRHLRSL